jgi:hypothetical protein
MHVIHLRYPEAARIAAMLRPIEEPEPEVGSISYADADRIMAYLPGKLVYVRWSVLDDPLHERRFYTGDVIETIQEEPNETTHTWRADRR